jgi:hypothetical protein
MILLFSAFATGCRKAGHDSAKSVAVKLVSWHEGHVVADSTPVAQNSISGFHKGVFTVKAPLEQVLDKYLEEGYTLEPGEKTLLRLQNTLVTLNRVDSTTTNLLIDIKPVNRDD